MRDGREYRESLMGDAGMKNAYFCGDTAVPAAI